MSISMEFHGNGNSLMESLDQLVDQLVDRKTLLFYQPIPYITTKKMLMPVPKATISTSEQNYSAESWNY